MIEVTNTNDNYILVSWDKDIFRSDDESFCVGLFKNKSENAEKATVICKGSSLPQISNVTFMFYGSWIDDKKYGKQFSVTRYEEKIGDTKDDIVNYLSSGLFKGIGKKTAEKIFAVFGNDALNIIGNDHEKLCSIKGITKSQAEKIHESYEENHIPKELVDMLLGKGFSTASITKIYRQYKQDAVTTIKDNPYALCSVSGISFNMADSLREGFKIPLASPTRLLAAEIEVVKKNFFCGKVGITMESLVKGTAALSGINDEKLIKSDIIGNIKQGSLSYRKLLIDGNIKQYIYTEKIKSSEEKLAKLIAGKLAHGKDDSKKALGYLSKHDSGIELDASQKGAVLNAFSSKISIITGGPGTGKTTTIKVIAEVDRAINGKDKQLFLAPTGRAARRITESSGFAASTIHSVLRLRPLDDERVSAYKESDEDDIIRDKTIIIDEFSMVDMMLALALFERTENCRYIIVGDSNQLPSVGAGNVLKDLIESGCIPVSRLKYVHRQDERSHINENANNMQEGTLGFLQGDDFKVSYAPSMKEIEDGIVNAYLSEIRKNKDVSIAVLCPYRNYEAGMLSVNSRIQEMINPSGEEFKGRFDQVFRAGDPVMHVRKNTEDAVNGDIGVVECIRENKDGERAVYVRYETGEKSFIKEYTIKDIDQLALSYAMTVHKSQGSEYDVIITLLTRMHKNFVVRNIPYTAITRARKKVYFFTDSENTIDRAIENNSMEDRNTLLSYLINEECKKADTLKKKPFKKAEKKSESGVDGQMSLNFQNSSLQTNTKSII